MPTAICDGIPTRYETFGDGPPLLLFSPGGFNATIENWSSFSIYKRLNLLDDLQKHFRCIAFDKRESGQSGGRVETLTWQLYAKQGRELLDHLGVERAHLMGGCIGCSIAATLAEEWPDRVDRLILYSPAGGETYRRTQLDRFGEHVDYVAEHGLRSVVELARQTEATFAQDPRIGPWASVIRRDETFAGEYARRDVDEYTATAGETASRLFDGDPVPAAPFDAKAPTLVVPGGDANHRPEAARELAASLPKAELWDVPTDTQTEQTAPARVREFLQK